MNLLPHFRFYRSEDQVIAAIQGNILADISFVGISLPLDTQTQVEHWSRQAPSYAPRQAFKENYDLVLLSGIDSSAIRDQLATRHEIRVTILPHLRQGGSVIFHFGERPFQISAIAQVDEQTFVEATQYLANYVPCDQERGEVLPKFRYEPVTWTRESYSPARVTPASDNV